MNFIKEYLSFNKRERNGLFILSFIIVSLLAYNYWLNYKEANASQVDFSNFENSIKEFYESNSIENLVSNSDSLFNTDTSKTEIQTELFSFNPNIATDEEFKQLGLSDKQIKNIRNYLQKAGSFRFKEDFGKLYSIGDSLFAILNPYLDLPDKESYYAALNISNTKQENTKYEKKQSSKPLVELNSADSLQLIDVKGIGSAFASRIIKYRNRLGGFQRVEQLLEVYGMKEEQYNLIKSQVKVDPSVTIKIHINTCTPEELKNHPYINNWNIANALVNYRKKHGNFKVLEDIKKCDLVNDELYLKLAPYLTLN
jgi:competence ComEA-like helix-hairpin-helix protein